MQLIEQVGFLFYPLSFFSILATAIVVERTFFFISISKAENSSFYQEIKSIIAKNSDLEKVLIDEVVAFKLMQIQEKLEYGLNSLRIIAVLSPMIGLLGTVIGMIKAFKIISLQNSPVAPAMIADGLWNAMLTTAYGLIISIPALFLMFVFLRISEKYLLKLQNLANIESFKVAKVKIDD